MRELVAAEQMKDPGLRWLVTPTSDYKNPEGPFAWFNYVPIGEGFVHKLSGWAHSRERAEHLAQADVRPAKRYVMPDGSSVEVQ